jgi:hypothetical protein
MKLVGSAKDLKPDSLIELRRMRQTQAKPAKTGFYWQSVMLPESNWHFLSLLRFGCSAILWLVRCPQAKQHRSIMQRYQLHSKPTFPVGSDRSILFCNCLKIHMFPFDTIKLPLIMRRAICLKLQQ